MEKKNERWELISTVQSIKTRITYRFCLFCDVHDVHINFVGNNGMVIKNSSLPTRPNLAYFRLKHTPFAAPLPKSNLVKSISLGFCVDWNTAHIVDDYVPKRFVAIRFVSFGVFGDIFIPLPL